MAMGTYAAFLSKYTVMLSVVVKAYAEVVFICLLVPAVLYLSLTLTS